VSASVRLLGLGLESHRGRGCLSVVNIVCIRERSQRLVTRPEESYRLCYLEASQRSDHKGHTGRRATGRKYIKWMH